MKMPMQPGDHEPMSLGDEWLRRSAHCLWCGGRLALRFVHGAERLACSACAFVLYRSPAAAVATAVLRGREVLLVQRAIEPYRGLWGFPAGYQEYDESPEQAAVRETREEAGVEVELRGVLDVCWTTDDPRKRANLVVYRAVPVAGEPQAADDASAARYFSLDDLPEGIAFTNNRRLLERLRRET